MDLILLDEPPFSDLMSSFSGIYLSMMSELRDVCKRNRRNDLFVMKLSTEILKVIVQAV